MLGVPNSTFKLQWNKNTLNLKKSKINFKIIVVMFYLLGVTTVLTMTFLGLEARTGKGLNHCQIYQCTQDLKANLLNAIYLLECLYLFGTSFKPVFNKRKAREWSCLCWEKNKRKVWALCRPTWTSNIIDYNFNLKLFS